MNKFKERYIFGFESDQHDETILWRYTDEAEHPITIEHISLKSTI